MSSRTHTSVLPPRTAGKPTRSTFRRDIQGIRAVAVLVVFLDHMLGWPAGGFIGVDMFFVISGYLITGILLREYESTGHIAFKKFYAGRAKRIFPAAILTLAVTALVGFLVFTQQRALSIVWDSVWAFLFVANWNFAVDGTDYFQQGGATSPIQHFWSLSVEEQFYFVWPWTLLGLLYVSARFVNMTTTRVRIVAGTAIGLIVVVSFGFAVVQAISAPTIAYFSTLTRAWELGAGALVAVVAPRLTRIAPAARTALAYGGLVVMIGACFVITPATPWPAPWALLPVIGTVLVIVSGIGSEPRYIWPLTNPVAVYIGDISYSLYLWHFPVIVFAIALFPAAGPLAYLGIAVAGFGIAIASYHAVEKPIWKSPLWTSRTSRGAWREWRATYGPQAVYGSLVGLSVTTAVVVLIALLPTLTPRQAIAYEPPASREEPVTAATTADELATEVEAALAATTWPALTPSIDEIGPDAKVAAWVNDGCLSRERGAEADFRQTTERCVYGDPSGDKTVMLIGDSVAISWLPALEEALDGDGWRILVFAMQQCPFVDVSVHKANGDPHPDCDAFHDWTAAEVARINPHMIVASQLDGLPTRINDGSNALTATASTLISFSAPERQVVALGAPTPTVALEQCYTSTGSPRDCVGTAPVGHGQANSLLADAATAAGDAFVRFVNTDSMFCLNGNCPAQVGGLVVRADGAHLTEVYSRRIGAALDAKLQL